MNLMIFFSMCIGYINGIDFEKESHDSSILKGICTCIYRNLIALRKFQMIQIMFTFSR